MEATGLETHLTEVRGVVVERDYVAQPSSTEYSGLKPVGERIFDGPTSIKYWM